MSEFFPVIYHVFKLHILELSISFIVLVYSSGKNSVIESLVRCSFLPKGIGNVTGSHLVLQFVYCPKDDREYSTVLKKSPGKSSMIESLVGCSFLPKGTGIVTRSN